MAHDSPRGIGGRRVVGNISLSLDGRTTGRGGAYDMGWIVPHALTDRSRERLATLTAGTTTVLLGRKNYEGFSSYWPAVAADEAADPRDRSFSRWLDGVDKVVFSRTLDTVDWHHARLATADPAATVRALREEGGADVVVLSSASIIRALLDAGELDRLSLMLCPEIVGGGARLFDEGQAASSWSLTESEPTGSGAISLVYERRDGVAAP
jgi:dihydrofolate reductase